MGRFRREGAFADREAFLGTLRLRLAHLRSNLLPGMSETWEREDGRDVARVAGYGVVVCFRVGERDWRCDADLPDWLPIPQAVIEEKFDEEFVDLLDHRDGGGA
ncbi:MAG: hypothetical protein HYY17_15660 [Planctomycetes bacterium]|nr:hypothetical protein [Planctomycetota bacterium]